eukprot:6490938-Amphidinium_carterae.1
MFGFKGPRHINLSSLLAAVVHVYALQKKQHSMPVRLQAESSSTKLGTTRQQASLKEQKKKRKQCGGAWRAFVHVHLRGKQASADDFTTLASQYHALTPEQREHYTQLGLAATMAATEGKSTFPCHSLRAAQLRGGPDSAHQWPSRPTADPIAEHVRSLYVPSQERSKREAAELAADTKQLQEYARKRSKQVLSRHLFLESTGCKWQAFPHRTLALATHFDAEHLVGSDAFQEQTSTMEAEWERMHRGIPAHSFSTVVPPLTVEQEKMARPKRCLQTGTCLCQGLGTMWTKVSSRLKALLKDVEKTLLLSGDIILEWCKPTDSAIVSLAFTHVALLYQRPWRPTHLMVELVAKEGDKATFKAILDEQRCCVFRTAVAFLSTLPSDSPLDVRVYSMSQRAAPCPAFNSTVHCELRPEFGGNVWRGAQQERKRKRHKPRDKRPLHEKLSQAADAEPIEDEDDADWQAQIYALEHADGDADLGESDTAFANGAPSSSASDGDHNDIAICTSSSEDEAAADEPVGSSSSSSSAEMEVVPPPKAPVPVARPARAAQDARGSLDKFKVDDSGELRFKWQDESLYAHCSRHKNCRKVRTTKPGNRRPGQGRPLGYLVAWLTAPDLQIGLTAGEHEHFLPSLSDRKEARAKLRSMCGSDWLFALERPANPEADGSDGEPAVFT